MVENIINNEQEQEAPPEFYLTDEDVKAVRPLDLLNSNNYIDKEKRDKRLDICRDCERLFKPTKTCLECGCFMGLKTWLKDASCPIKKW